MLSVISARWVCKWPGISMFGNNIARNNRIMLYIQIKIFGMRFIRSSALKYIFRNSKTPFNLDSFAKLFILFWVSLVSCGYYCENWSLYYKIHMFWFLLLPILILFNKHLYSPVATRMLTTLEKIIYMNYIIINK